MIRSGVITGRITLLLYMTWFTLLPVSIAATLPAFGQASGASGCCSKGCCCARAGGGSVHQCECCKKQGSCDCGFSSRDDAASSILILRASALPQLIRIHRATQSSISHFTPAHPPALPDLVIPSPPPKPVFAG